MMRLRFTTSSSDIQFLSNLHDCLYSKTNGMLGNHLESILAVTIIDKSEGKEEAIERAWDRGITNYGEGLTRGWRIGGSGLKAIIGDVSALTRTMVVLVSR
ncbi:hypothetical protein BDD12DRAFT_823510 [Trichophaea hybrida]|nr:hypothetical protein BDD12DRAFT_823510 [Trichophaea hybrida]